MKMMTAICDDNTDWLPQIYLLVNHYAMENRLNMETICYGDPEALLSYTGAPLDAVFLSLESRKQNGLETAALINKQWPHCQIIFMTEHIDYASEVSRVYHLYFVLKKQLEKKLEDIFLKLCSWKWKLPRTLSFVCINKTVVNLFPEEIYYFERHDRKTLLHTIWGTYELYERINDLEQRIPPTYFLRCHNSYIVYLPNVRELKGGCFSMRNGHSIMISRQYQKSARQAFTQWSLHQIHSQYGHTL